MEEKIKLIDEIIKRHPAYGTEKGWSEYTGGMKDTGSWFFRKMLDVPIHELKCFLKAIELEEAQPPLPPDTSKRIIIVANGKTCWTTEAQMEATGDLMSTLYHKLLFGKL